jgi:hypothetical protein
MQEGGVRRMYRHLDGDLESQPGKLPIWDREIFHTVATRAGPSLWQLMDFAESFRFFPWLLDSIKTAANARDVPYQSLIKVWLQEKLQGS